MPLKNHKHGKNHRPNRKNKNYALANLIRTNEAKTGRAGFYGKYRSNKTLLVYFNPASIIQKREAALL